MRTKEVHLRDEMFKNYKKIRCILIEFRLAVVMLNFCIEACLVAARSTEVHLKSKMFKNYKKQLKHTMFPYWIYIFTDVEFLRWGQFSCGKAHRGQLKKQIVPKLHQPYQIKELPCGLSMMDKRKILQKSTRNQLHNFQADLSLTDHTVNPLHCA